MLRMLPLHTTHKPKHTLMPSLSFPALQVDFSERPFKVLTDEKEIEAQAVIIATGAVARRRVQVLPWRSGGLGRILLHDSAWHSGVEDASGGFGTLGVGVLRRVKVCGLGTSAGSVGGIDFRS